MSEKTNALNAYVTGIGDNSRIVLWDTTLKRLSDEEILFIMAHEIGHYVKKDIYLGIAEYLLTTLIGLWLIAKIMPWFIRRYGSLLKISENSLQQFDFEEDYTYKVMYSYNKLMPKKGKVERIEVYGGSLPK